MKREYVILITIVVVLLTSACEKQLDLAPQSSLTNASFWQTQTDANAAYYGLNCSFRCAMDDRLFYWGEARAGYFTLGYSGGAYDYQKFWENNLTSDNNRTNWSMIYVLINDANLILKHVPAITFNVQSEKDKIIGTAYFMRAFSYFQLAKNWGDVPISTEAFESTTQDLTLVRQPAADAFTQAKTDVDKALGLLTDAGTPGKNAYFVSKTATQMLKADIYLWTAKVLDGGTSDLNTAKTAIDAVIASGYILEPSFSTVFRNEANKEVILSQYYSNLEEGRSVGGSSAQLTRNNTGSVISAMMLQGPAGVSAQYQNNPVPIQRTGGNWIYLDTVWVRQAMKPSDTRTSISWMTFKSGTFYTQWLNKYLGTLVSGSRYLTDDIIIYRFAEAILMKAEIENALNNTSEAIIQLNKVAKRAYGTDNYYAASLTKTQVDNAIIDETHLEFILEGKTFWTIRRFGQEFTRIPSLIGRQADRSGNILLLPVAQDVINRNPKIIQTDGY